MIAYLIAFCLLGSLQSPVLAAPHTSPPHTSPPHTSPPHTSPPPPPHTRFLLAHYLPWFQAKPFSPQWGWHWTMNKYNPEHSDGGQPQIASHFHPLMGAYDSGDPEALECQVMLMKLAGIDGVVIDWYGPGNDLDYGLVNRNTLRLIPLLRLAHLHFVICYEDQSVPKEIAGGVFPLSEAVSHGQEVMRTMQAQFFSSPAALTVNQRPVLLSFGEPYYADNQWTQLFSVLPRAPLYLTETVKREPKSAAGAFDWPLPGGGTQQALAEQSAFCRAAGQWTCAAAVAFPRFQDIYAEADVGKSYGTIDDQNGQTYAATLANALQSKAAIVQIATWNDWGEGTQIEPSAEFGYRDLIATQSLRRRYWGSSFAGTADDLHLPIAWYQLSKQNAARPAVHATLAAFFGLVMDGHLKEARALLARCKNIPARISNPSPGA